MVQVSGMSPDALRRPTPFLFSRGVKAADAALWAVNIRQLSRIDGENLSPREKRKGVFRRRPGSLLRAHYVPGGCAAQREWVPKSSRRAAGGATCRVGALLKAANRAREWQNTVGLHAFSFRLMRLAFVFISVHPGFRHCDIFTALVQ